TAMWTQKNDLPFSGFWRGAAFEIAGRGYIAYGFTNSNKFNHNIYEYSQATDTWSVVPNVTLDARKYLGCEVINNKAFFYAGQDSLNAVLNDVKVFDPATYTLTTQNGIPAGGRKGGMTFTLNNTFYITTGFNSANQRIKETWKTDGVVGLQDELKVQSLKFKVYPNPTNSSLKIESDDFLQEKEISVLNALGQKMETEISVSNKTAVIYTAELPDGIYFLSVKDQNGTSAKRFVVLH
ncbi:MAG: hypothetical protein K0S12_1317, partial [Bacteroidetes bacterium]|nr:hypothetical protein [Bacteroidota bacterium]